MKHICETEQIPDQVQIWYEVMGYWILEMVDLDEYGDDTITYTVIKFCPFCGEKLE